MKQDIHMSAEELSVHIQLNEGLVTQLTFEGSNSQDPILKTFTKHCIGYSLRESAEHSAIYTVSEALRGTPRNASQGIDSVTMLSPAIAQAQALLRKAYKEHKNDEDGWNYEDRGLSSAWMAQSKDEQREKILPVQLRYLQQKGHAEDIISLTEIDTYGRLFYEFQEGTPSGIKPALLMGLESFFQETLQERLEVFLTEMKDQHKLRRL